MQLSYGPPGHKGVTTLMAVGADELEPTRADAAVNKGLLLAAGVWALGYGIGSKTVRHMGLGALLALAAVRAVAGSVQKVAVEQDAPTPAGLFYVI